MSVQLRVSLIFLCLLWAGCSNDDASQGAGGSSAQQGEKAYVSQADLSGILERGTIRFVAPYFDGANALPRDGVPVLNYQQLAESYAAEKGLAVKWVFVDGFADLQPALKQGRADVIVTNMTVTESRKETLAFTRALASINEWLIAPTDSNIKSIKDLAGFKLAAPRGSSYEETLEKLAAELDNLQLSSLGSKTSDIDLLEMVNEGQFDAVLMDSDVANSLLGEFRTLEKKISLPGSRAIAWAVRNNNPDLLRSINNFLVSHHVRKAANSDVKKDWEAIKNTGRLRMLTLNNPASYFMWRGELMGFDFDLMKKFADQHDLHLGVVIKNSIPELFDALKRGEGDVIAASITVDKEREGKGVIFSKPYLFVDEQIVGKKAGEGFDSLDALEGSRVVLNPETVFYKELEAQLKGKNNVELVSLEGETTEALLAKVVTGDYDYTVADSHLVALEKAYHQNLEAKYKLREDVPIAWGVRKNQKALVEQLNVFIKKKYRGLFYNVTYKKYFENERRIKKYQSGRVEEGGKLSPYDELVKKYADKYGMDWRLIAAQMYQESKFNPKVRSFAGALGLMQVLPSTAKEFGYSNLRDPEIGIAAGVTYMDWLEERFPGDMDVQERIFFTLAAYNAGTGHVRDARKLARELGYDNKRWFGHVEKAMLKLSKPQYYKKARFGYVRGSEPVAYVREIHDRYLGYLGQQ